MVDGNSLTDRIVNALSYLSILLLPAIFPLIAWVIAKSNDRPTTVKNARYAFWSQIFPLLYIIDTISVFNVFSLDSANSYGGALFGTLLIFALLLALLLFIYNIVMAVKMLIGRE